MADLAARLGVSRQLVPIALRGLPGASSETRERVREGRRGTRLPAAPGGAMPVAGIRIGGYMRAASAAGFEADAVSVPEPDYTEEAGAAAGRILLGRNEPSTTVVTSHDQQAAGCCKSCPTRVSPLRAGSR